MAIKYIKSCATSLVIWKMQIQTQGSTATHPLEWLKVKRPATPSVGEELEELEPSYTLLVATLNGAVTSENSLWQFLKKLSIHIYKYT